MAGSDAANQSEVPRWLPEGYVLRDRYRVQWAISPQYMHTVYLGLDLQSPQSQELCVIKEFLHPTVYDRVKQDNLEVFSRQLKGFRRRLSILMALRHPALMTIRDHFSENNRDYYVAEYIEGDSLGAILENPGEHLPIEQIRQWAIGICDALSYLHRQEPDPVIFGNMTPWDMLVDGDGQIHLVDYGTSDEWYMWICLPHGYFVLPYWPPESFHGEASPQTDIYALGATLHHALTRRGPRLEPPFSWEKRPIQQFNPAVPDGLVAVVNRALAYEPSDRFTTADDMRQALEALG